MTERRAIVTGGGGFVGSHLVEYLLEVGKSVTVVDNLSTGRRPWIPNEADFVETDLKDPNCLNSISNPIDTIYHLSARPSVTDKNPREQFRENTLMTYNVVNFARENGINEIVFTSSSTVYGEAPSPTPENFGPLEPISDYGASKLACEGILSSAAHTTDLKVYNFRFANIVGPRSRGAVIPDFIEKLHANPHELEILGNGKQEKSYLYIDDCIDAIFHAKEHANGSFNTYNLGTNTTTSVKKIADIVSDEMDITPEYSYTGGARGWTGDVPQMRLDIQKLEHLGWSPTLESDEAVRLATRELLAEMD